MNEEEVRAFSKEAAHVAARWWVERYIKTPRPFDNGDPVTSGLAELFTSQRPVSPAPTAAELEKFHGELASRIFAELWTDSHGKPAEFRHMTLGFPSTVFGIDYRPNGVLSDAIEAAGLGNHPRTRTLPVKTTMRVHLLHVMVSAGYRAPWETLFDKRPQEYKFAEVLERAGFRLKHLTDDSIFMGERDEEAVVQVSSDFDEILHYIELCAGEGVLALPLRASKEGKK